MKQNKTWKKNLRKAAILYCGIYTVTTIINSVLYLLNGIYEDPSGNWHELMRAGIILIGVSAYLLAQCISIRQNFIKACVIYMLTMGMAFLLVFFSGFIDPLSKHAYRDIFFNYTGLFIIISIFIMLAGRVRKGKSLKESENEI